MINRILELWKIYQHPELSKGLSIYQLNSKLVRIYENLNLYLASLSRFINKNSFEISMDMRSNPTKKIFDNYKNEFL